MKFTEKIVFWLGLVVAVVPPPLLSYYGHNETAGFCIVSGIVAMLATRFGDIAVLAFGPLRAELREKIEEADQTMQRLKELTATTAKAALDLIQSAGRWEALTDEHIDGLYNSYGTLLDDLKIDRGPIEAFWHTVIEYDYILMATGGTTIPTGANAGEMERWEGLRRGIENRASPDEIRAFLNDTRYNANEREELVQDLEHYRQHREHRRPDVWADRKRYYVNNPLTRPDQ